MAQIPITTDQDNVTIDLGQIQFGRSITPGAVPAAANMKEGAIEINLADKAIFTKDHNGNVVPLGKDYAADIAAAQAAAEATAQAYTDAQVVALKGGADTANDTLAKLAGRIDQLNTDLGNGLGALTKADVGLGNVENYSISDATDQDVSTQYASSKAVYDTYQRAVLAETTAIAHADQVKSDLLGGAPAETLDTLFELANEITNNQTAIDAINNAIATKAATTYVDAELAKKVDILSISDLTNSQSQTNVASSKAVDDLRQALETAINDGLALKVDKSSISDAIDSTSTTNVASSQAVNLARQAAVDHASSLVVDFAASMDYGRTF